MVEYQVEIIFVNERGQVDAHTETIMAEGVRDAAAQAIEIADAMKDCDVTDVAVRRSI